MQRHQRTANTYIGRQKMKIKIKDLHQELKKKREPHHKSMHQTFMKKENRCLEVSFPTT